MKLPIEIVLCLGITTARRTTDYLSGTLESLAEAGFDPPIVRYDHAHTGVCRNFKELLRLMLRTDAEAYAICQDDILVAKGLRRWLDESLWPNEASRIGAVSLYLSAHQQNGDSGWLLRDMTPLEIGKRQPWCGIEGALFLVLPAHAAKRYVNSNIAPERRTMLEAVVGEFCGRNKLEFWQHAPSLVQHVGLASAIQIKQTRGGPMQLRKKLDVHTSAGNWMTDCYPPKVDDGTLATVTKTD